VFWGRGATQAAHPGALVDDSTWIIEKKRSEKHRVGLGGLIDTWMLCASGVEELSTALWEKTSKGRMSQTFPEPNGGRPQFQRYLPLGQREADEDCPNQNPSCTGTGVPTVPKIMVV